MRRLMNAVNVWGVTFEDLTPSKDVCWSRYCDLADEVGLSRAQSRVGRRWREKMELSVGDIQSMNKYSASRDYYVE